MRFRKRQEALGVPPAAEPADELESLRALGESMERTLRAALHDGRDEKRNLAQLATSLALRIESLERERGYKRALQLLVSHLNEKQRKTWDKSRFVDVKGLDTTYRIQTDSRDGRVAVYALNRGTHSKTKNLFLCTYSTKDIPVPDQILAIKIQIEANEEEFLKVAFPNSNSYHRLKVDGTIEQVAPYLGSGGFFYGGGWLEAGVGLNELRRRIGADVAEATVQNQYFETTTFGDTNRTFLTAPQIRYRVEGEAEWQTLEQGAIPPANTTVTETLTETTT